MEEERCIHMVYTTLSTILFIFPGNCISSVGYGSDVDRGMFQGYSRNNIFFNRKENNPKARGCGIYESHSHTNNHFDYDLFFDANKKDKKGEAV